jgi:hypothetical protein
MIWICKIGFVMGLGLMDLYCEMDGPMVLKKKALRRREGFRVRIPLI